jgi:hypothetical protein
MVDCLYFIPIAVKVLLAELLVLLLPVFKKSICIGVYENVYFNALLTIADLAPVQIDRDFRSARLMCRI